MKKLLRRAFAGDTIRRIIRTFVIAFATVLVPGLLGWLNDVSQWASTNGQHPFPNAHNLSYLAVSAVVAGFIAAGNAIWLVVENVSGRGFLRNAAPSEDVPAVPGPGEGGLAELTVIAICAVIVAVVAVCWFFGVRAG